MRYETSRMPRISYGTYSGIGKERTHICYPTEHNAKDEYKYCHHCGKLLDWDDVSMSEDYRKLEEMIK